LGNLAFDGDSGIGGNSVIAEHGGHVGQGVPPGFHFLGGDPVL